MNIRLKRAYDPVEPNDGFRVLVDRLWPRGIKKEALALDLWLKEIAPSPELRTWFKHESAKFKEFSQRYQTELDHSAAFQTLAGIIKKHPTVTLIYAARDPKVNHAAVLRDYTLGRLS
jgi:uncharacterized protein YeaO (DUF488 family)